MTQALGIITWIQIDKEFNFIKEIVVGVTFLGLTFADLKWFRMYPAEENIFVEDPLCRRKEKQVFDSVYSAVKLNGSALKSSNKKQSVFSLSYSNLGQSRISFRTPFGDKHIF